MQPFRDFTVYVYMLRCADESYYVGSTRKTLDERVGEHNSGVYTGYTFARRPVALVWSQDFPNAVDAIACERQVKGWSRAKKEALIRGDWNLVSFLARRRGGRQRG
jgi:putative endonuclease